ncbi:MAG: hypothetical protein AAFY59_11305 [Pseudomonadota bacterium]
MSAETAPGRRGAGVGRLLAKLVMLVLGLAVGLFAGAVMLDRPDSVALIWEAMQAQFQELRYGQFAFPRLVLGLLAVLLGFVAFYILLRSTALIGLALGVFAWLPFGTHILEYAPEVRVQFPDLEANLMTMIGERERLNGIRDWGLAMVPLPEGVEAVRPEDFGTTEQAEAGEPRLPQIGQ